mmetsp:Transcript_11403/g.36253  ORF Transcript_11403/g.36253 Transcript_11403/m.36253 type:complete len:227 (-) Transcript_11403:348-1028(-)
MRRESQPLKKIGKHRKSRSMLLWSMQHLSSHTRGSRWCRVRNARLQPCSAVHFAGASSCQECETKTSQRPNRALSERACSAGLGRLSLMSSKDTLSRLTQQKCRRASWRACFGSDGPMRQAMLAAALTAPRAPSLRLSFVCSLCTTCGRAARPMTSKFGMTWPRLEGKTRKTNASYAACTPCCRAFQAAYSVMEPHIPACIRGAAGWSAAHAAHSTNAAFFAWCVP